jgi:hypothetical protein
MVPSNWGRPTPQSCSATLAIYRKWMRADRHDTGARATTLTTAASRSASAWTATATAPPTASRSSCGPARSLKQQPAMGTGRRYHAAGHQDGRALLCPRPGSSGSRWRLRPTANSSVFSMSMAPPGRHPPDQPGRGEEREHRRVHDHAVRLRLPGGSDRLLHHGAATGLRTALKTAFVWSDSTANAHVGISGMNGLSDQQEQTTPPNWTRPASAADLEEEGGRLAARGPPTGILFERWVWRIAAPVDVWATRPIRATRDDVGS